SRGTEGEIGRVNEPDGDIIENELASDGCAVDTAAEDEDGPGESFTFQVSGFRLREGRRTEEARVVRFVGLRSISRTLHSLPRSAKGLADLHCGEVVPEAEGGIDGERVEDIGGERAAVAFGERVRDGSEDWGWIAEGRRWDRCGWSG